MMEKAEIRAGLFYEPDVDTSVLLSINDQNPRLWVEKNVELEELVRRLETGIWVTGSIVTMVGDNLDFVEELLLDYGSLIIDHENNFLFSLDDGVCFFASRRIDAAQARLIDGEARQYMADVEHFGFFPTPTKVAANRLIELASQPR